MPKNKWSDLDIIEELRLRTWARENYVSNEHRDSTWHGVILDEMQRRDREDGKNFISNPAEVMSRLRGDETTEELTGPRILKA